jgi:ribonuclease R
MTTYQVRGKISVHTRGFGFLDFEAEGGALSAFVAPPDLNRFLEGDVAAATVTESEPGRYSATNLTLVERSREQLFGAIVFHGKKPFLKVDRLVSNTDWPIEGDGVAELPDGAWLVADIKGTKVAPRRLVKDPSGVSLARVCARHGIRVEHPEPVIAEASKAARTRLPAGRRDLRALPTLTIDAIYSKDLDDALAILPAGDDGALRVFVSIADVDAYVPRGSEVDREAALRGTSVYLAGQVIPMLPELLCNEVISLNEGVDRPAMTVEIRIDGEGSVTSVDLYTSIIRSHARLTYDMVNDYLVTGLPGPIPVPVQETVRWLRTAAARLSMFRSTRGGIELLREEASISWVAGSQEPSSIVSRADTEAHRIIERIMVAANEAVARWLVERGLPGIFRVHDEPDPDRVKNLAQFAHNFGFELGIGRHLSPRSLAAFEAQFLGSARAPALRTVLGRVLGPARYTVHPTVHFGLAAPMYLHFTSPIRRYADLAVHRVVKAYLAGHRGFIADDPSFEELAQRLNELAFHATKAETESVRMVAARLFSGRIGERVDGNVVAIKPFGLVVQIVGTGVTGTVAFEALPDGPYTVDPSRYFVSGSHGRYSIGDALELEVTGANEELGRIDLTPIPA